MVEPTDAGLVGAATAATEVWTVENMFSRQELDGHPVENWSVNEVQKWMIKVNLQSVNHVFFSHGIDGKTLLSIDREFLGQHGIYERDLQTKILSAIYEVKVAHGDGNTKLKYSPPRNMNNLQLDTSDFIKEMSSPRKSSNGENMEPRPECETNLLENSTKIEDKNNCVLDKNQNNVSKSLDYLDITGMENEEKLHVLGSNDNLECIHTVSMDCLSSNCDIVDCDLSRFSASADVLNFDNDNEESKNDNDTSNLEIDNQMENQETSNSKTDNTIVNTDVTSDNVNESPAVSQDLITDNSKQLQNDDIIEGSIQVDGSILSSDLQARTFVISNRTTAKELISLVLTKYNMASRDPNLFYLTMETSSKNMEKPIQSVVTIGEMSCPLDLQLHNKKDTKFCIQMKSGGLVKVYDSCLTPGSFYKSMFISKKTTSRELIKLLLHYYKSREYVDDFVLMETDDQGNELRRLSESECPLITQQRWKSEKCFQLKRIGKKSNSVQRSRSFGGVSEHGREHLQAALKRSAQRRKQRSNFIEKQEVEENTAPLDERTDQIEKLRGSLLQLQQDKNSVFFNNQPVVKPAIDTAPRDLLREKIENFNNIRSSFLTKTEDTKSEITTSRSVSSDKPTQDPELKIKEDDKDVNKDSKSLNDDELKQSIRERKLKLEETLRVRSAKARYARISEIHDEDCMNVAEHVRYKKEQPNTDRLHDKRYNTLPGDSMEDSKKALDIQEFKGRIYEKLYSLSRQPSKKKPKELDANDPADQMTEEKSLEDMNTESGNQEGIEMPIEVVPSEVELKSKENAIKKALAEEKAKLLKSVDESSSTYQKRRSTSVTNQHNTTDRKVNLSLDTKHRSLSSSTNASSIKGVQSEIMSAKDLRNIRMPVAVRPIRALASGVVNKPTTTPRDRKTLKDLKHINDEAKPTNTTRVINETTDEKPKQEPNDPPSEASGRLSGAAVLLRKKRGRRCLPTIPLSSDLEERKRRLAENAQVRLRAYSSSRASVTSVDDVSEASTLKNIDNIESEAESIPDQFVVETKTKNLPQTTRAAEQQSDSFNTDRDIISLETQKTNGYESKISKNNVIDDLPALTIDNEAECVPEYLLSPSKPDDSVDGFIYDQNLSFDFESATSSPRSDNKTVAAIKTNVNDTEQNLDLNCDNAQCLLSESNTSLLSRFSDILTATGDRMNMNDRVSLSKKSDSLWRTPGDGQDENRTVYNEPLVKNVNRDRVHKKSSTVHPQTLKSTINRLEEKTNNILMNSQSNDRKADPAKSLSTSDKPNSTINQISLVTERRKARTRSTGSVSSSRPTSSKSSVSRSASVKTNSVIPRHATRQNNVTMPQKTLARHPSNNSLVSESETSGFADQDYSHSSRSSKLRNTQNLNRLGDYSPEHSVKSYSGSHRVPQSAREPKSFSSFSNAAAPLSARDPPSHAIRKVSKTGHSQEEILQAKQALLMYAAEPVVPRSSSRILTITPQKSLNRSHGEHTPHNQSMYQPRMTPDSEAAITPHNMSFSTPQIAKYPIKSNEKSHELDVNSNLELQRIRPSLNDVVRTCDLFTVEVKRGSYSKLGIRLFESVFIDAGASPKRQALRSPKGKRPMIGQNNSAFTRVRTSSESEVKSIISIDSIEENSAALHNGHLQEGDHIIEIDDKYVLPVHVTTAQAYVQKAGDVLKLVIARVKGGTSTCNSILEGSNLLEQSFDIGEEKDMLKLKYQSLMMESQQKDKLIEELRSIIVKRAQVRQIKDGMKPFKLNIDDLEEECSAV